MKYIGLLSDTHGFLDPTLFDHFAECDEIWHAGDIGTEEVADRLEAFKPLRAVYGNIDGPPLRRRYPEWLIFELEGIKVLMIHIGGYPGRYPSRIKKMLQAHRPRLFICGHSHLLKVMPDKNLDLLHMNPGACGREGFHHMRTAMRFKLSDGNILQPEVIELGLRSAMF